MRNVTHRWPQSGYFFPKLGHFFPIFEKGRGRPLPSPLYTPESIWKTNVRPVNVVSGKDVVQNSVS